MPLTPEQARNALRKTVDKVANQRAESMVANVLAAVDNKLAGVAGKVVISQEKPDVHIENKVETPSVTNEIQVDAPVIDTQCIANALKQSFDIFSTALIAVARQIAKDNAETRHLVAAALEKIGQIPAPEIKMEIPPAAPLPRREIVIERQGDNKLVVREV